MPDKDQPNKDDGNHLDEDDLERAEKGAAQESPLAANEEDAFVPDTELDNPDPAAKESAKKNDPTAGGAADH
jgi:hypothetical protein